MPKLHFYKIILYNEWILLVRVNGVDMIKLLLLCSMFFTSSLAFAEGTDNDYLDFLTKKTIQDFQKGIELYNSKKDAQSPAITKNDEGLYKMVAKKNIVHFSLINYLNDQIYINNRLTERSSLGLKLTSWLDHLITTAVAEDGNLDAESTKIILTALGSLTKNLEEVGMMCIMSSCKKEIREKNMKKILTTLNAQNEECAQQQYDQEKTIDRHSSYRMIDMLHSTLSPEFMSVKNLFKKVAEANKGAVQTFMEDKLPLEKNYRTCIGIMTAGTIADHEGGSLQAGSSILKSGYGGLNSDRMAQVKDEAKDVCVKMEELKGCMLSLKENLAVINNFKREEKRRSGYNAPTEDLPNINALGK